MLHFTTGNLELHVNWVSLFVMNHICDEQQATKILWSEQKHKMYEFYSCTNVNIQYWLAKMCSSSKFRVKYITIWKGASAREANKLLLHDNPETLDICFPILVSTERKILEVALQMVLT